MSNNTRRDAIKKMGFLAMGAGFTNSVFSTSPDKYLPIEPYFPKKYKKPDKPITAIVLGAGNRGNVYASYAKKFPDELKIVGVAEPIPHKNERFAKMYDIPDKHRFPSWDNALDVPKFADAIIITTPDALHYGPAMQGLPMGYDCILEKVIAQTWKECNDILKVAQKYKNIVAVCHVMRYMPYFRKLKEICNSGILGDIVSVQHLEPVEHIHMSHSFVRGPWRNTKESNPMILSKSCHDTDILRWLINKEAIKVSSFGGLSHFKKENAPEGSTKRCTGGCKIERDCPYSAIKVYYERGGYLGHLNLKDGSKEEIMEKLKTTQYGHCVYKTDNDVVDHQLCNFEFENGITAAFSMESLTHYGGRRTRFMGSMGHLFGDEKDIEYMDFRTRKITRWNISEANITSGHGGGDFGLVRDFIQASSHNDPSLLTSTIEASMESHLMGFKAEESRYKGGELIEFRI
ncbi:Gfo/Idh/MocA family protein [Bacteroidota bacterium]